MDYYFIYLRNSMVIFERFNVISVPPLTKEHYIQLLFTINPDQSVLLVAEKSFKPLFN